MTHLHSHTEDKNETHLIKDRMNALCGEVNWDPDHDLWFGYRLNLDSLGYKAFGDAAQYVLGITPEGVRGIDWIEASVARRAGLEAKRRGLPTHVVLCNHLLHNLDKETRAATHRVIANLPS